MKEEQKSTPAPNNLFTDAQEESEIDAIQSLLRFTVSGEVHFKINPYDAKSFFDLGRVLIFLIDTYRDFEKDNQIYVEDGLHRVYTTLSRLAVCSDGCEIGRGLATNDDSNGNKFFYCTTTHDLNTFVFAIEGVVERAKVYLKETFDGRTLADIIHDYSYSSNGVVDNHFRYVSFTNMQKKLLETLYREEAERRQAQAKAKWADDESRLAGKTDRVADTAEKILDKLKVQIVPSTVCVEFNDKFSKVLFKIPDEWNQKLFNNGKRMIITEKKRRKQKNGKVKDAIESIYTMCHAEGYDGTTPLNEFDRAVLGVTVSEYLAGNFYTTVNVIYRALTGKVGEAAAVPMKNQKEAIIQSVIKLMAKIVDFRKCADAYAQMNYTDKKGNELKFGVESLLSAGIVDAVVNGQEMEGVIYFKDQSPLFDLADAKNQVIRYPHELLDVPNQNNTPLVITLKKYVMRRICEIKLHKQLTPTITFADVFEKCRVADTDNRVVKRRRRNVILKFVEHLQEKEFIKTFEVISKNGLIHGITFTF